MNDIINILGKDYFTIKEAAFYAGVSESNFRKQAPTYGIIPSLFMGKLAYRKTDIQRAIEKGWLFLNNETGRGRSGGRTKAA